MSDIRLNLTGTGFGSIVVDGHDIGRAVTYLELHAPAGQPPVLTVMLKLDNVLAEGDQRVDVDPITKATLRALGWTAPGETS